MMGLMLITEFSVTMVAIRVKVVIQRADRAIVFKMFMNLLSMCTRIMNNMDWSALAMSSRY